MIFSKKLFGQNQSILTCFTAYATQSWITMVTEESKERVFMYFASTFTFKSDVERLFSMVRLKNQASLIHQQCRLTQCENKR